MRLPLVRSLFALALPALSLTGCTAGGIVDENFKLQPIEVPLTFVGVDANGNSNGSFYTWTPPSNGSPYVSFDPDAPASPVVDGLTISNTPVMIPAGDYYVSVLVPIPGGLASLASPIFHHDYYTTCTDAITKQTGIPCAPYWFQTFMSCQDWACVNGNGSEVPPSKINGGWRVIPMIVNYGPVFPPGPSEGRMQNGW